MPVQPERTRDLAQLVRATRPRVPWRPHLRLRVRASCTILADARALVSLGERGVQSACRVPPILPRSRPRSRPRHDVELGSPVQGCPRHHGHVAPGGPRCAPSPARKSPCSARLRGAVPRCVAARASGRPRPGSTFGLPSSRSPRAFSGNQGVGLRRTCEPRRLRVQSKSGG